MKYLKEYNNYEDIHSICNKYGIKDYAINSDGSIDTKSSVFINNCDLKKFPLKFNEVGGNFYCNRNQLTSLEGAPTIVGNFYCFGNQLTSLEGAPTSVGGNFYCHNSQLTSLKGAPTSVGDYFYCDNNPLPKLIFDNMKYIKEIIKIQNDYSIWRSDGSLDEYRFTDMMEEIMNI